MTMLLGLIDIPMHKQPHKDATMSNSVCEPAESQKQLKLHVQQNTYNGLKK